MLKRVKSAVPIVIAAILATGATAVAGTRGVRDSGGGGRHDNGGGSFTITDTISSSPTQQIPALLYPGVERYLWYNVRNTTSRPIEVTSIGIAATTAPTGCPVSELDLSGTNFAGELPVAPDSSAAVPVPLSLFETGTNQNSCEGKTFYFQFTGRAVVAASVRTRTRLVTSLNPSPVGQSVTYSAYVVMEGEYSGLQRGALTGSVTFTDNGATLCAGAPLTPISPNSSVATCVSPAYPTSGTHDVTAEFESATTEIESSVSRDLIQVIAPSIDHCRGGGRVEGDRDCGGGDR